MRSGGNSQTNPTSVAGRRRNDSGLVAMQTELLGGAWVGMGHDGSQEVGPFCALLGLELTRSTPDLLLTGFPSEVGLKLLEVVADATACVDYENRNVVVSMGNKPAVALLGERDIASAVPGVSDVYLGRHFRLIQCVMADGIGLFPWDAGFRNPNQQYYWGRSRFASWDDIPLNGIR